MVCLSDENTRLGRRVLFSPNLALLCLHLPIDVLTGHFTPQQKSNLTFLAPTAALIQMMCYYRSGQFLRFWAMISMISMISMICLGFLLLKRTSGVSPVIFQLSSDRLRAQKVLGEILDFHRNLWEFKWIHIHIWLIRIHESSKHIIYKSSKIFSRVHKQVDSERLGSQD